MPGCCVPHCSNHSRKGWRLFRLPTNVPRRQLWLNQIKRDNLQATRSATVCSAHFRPCDYEQNRLDGWHKLKPNAVPSIFPSHPALKPRKKLKLPRQSISTLPAPVENYCHLSTLCEVSTHVLQVSTVPKSIEHPSRSSSSSAGTDPLDEDKNLSGAGDNSSTSHFSSSQREGPSTRLSHSAELSKQLADVKRKYTDLQKYQERTDEDMRGLRTKVEALETELRNLKSGMRFLNEDQLQALSKNTMQGFSWSTNTIKQALQVRDTCGEAGYETLRSLGYPLPSITTLDRRLQSLSSLSGILMQAFNVLKSKIESMEDKVKDCILFVDKMEIMQVVERNHSEGQRVGAASRPRRPEHSTNCALVFTVGDINKRWTEAIAYLLSGQCIDNSVLKEFVVELVQLCSEIGLKVLAIASHVGTANDGIWQEFGFSSHKGSQTVLSIPHPVLQGEKLFFAADPVHVSKTISGLSVNSAVLPVSGRPAAN